MTGYSIPVALADNEVLQFLAGAFDGQPPVTNLHINFKKACDEDVCFSPGCVHAASAVLNNMNPDVKPCDNFYQFACGGFLESTVIPEKKSTVNTFNSLEKKLQYQLEKIMEGPSEPNASKPSRLVKNLFKSCMKQTTTDDKDLESFHKIFKKIGGWPVLDGETWGNDNAFDWISATYKLHDAGYFVNYFINFVVNPDSEGNRTRRVIYLDQPSLGLRRKHLVKGLDDKMVKAYYNYIVDIAVLLGAERERASTELEESLLFEINLANITLPEEELYDVTKMYNPMTLAQLKKNYPSIPWREYFSNLLPKTIVVEKNEIAIVIVPSFISALEKLISRTPKRVLANYVMWRAAQASLHYLSDDLRNRRFAYLNVLHGRVRKQITRRYECFMKVTTSLHLSVDAIYVRKYFNEETKRSVDDIFMNVREEFYRILREVEWMDKKSRENALEKAAALIGKIAYPEGLLDDSKIEEFYENLELTGGTYLESNLNLTRFTTKRSYSKLREPMNKNSWIFDGLPTGTNGYYSAYENSINIPAAILQGAIFNNNRPKYMNYGSTGFIIGHEIAHGFNDQGRRFDNRGKLVYEWPLSTKENFHKRAECIIHQYGNYTVKEIGLNVDGVNTQDENIADDGGIKQAYFAYNEWVQKNGPEQKLPALPYSPRQMFWISYANVFCSKYTPERLKSYTLFNSHSPDEFRIIGPLSNMPEFSEDFDCPLGSKMNPVKKCSVW